MKLKGNPDLEDGYIKIRKCNDWWFMPIFLAALLASLACAVYGWYMGDPRQLLIGWDSDGNGCGYSEATESYPYLYWPQAPDTAVVD